jgi:hypothetical protein
MKPVSLAALCSTVTLTALLLIGCGGSTKVDTANLQKTYQSAPGNVKSHVDKAVASLGAKQFPQAIRALRDGVKQGPPSEEQKDVLLDIIKQVQIIMAQNPKFDVNATYEAIEELDAAIEGRAPNTMPRMTEPPR